MRDRFGIFGTVTRFRELSLLLVMMLRIPNSEEAQWEGRFDLFGDSANLDAR